MSRPTALAQVMRTLRPDRRTPGIGGAFGVIVATRTHDQREACLLHHRSLSVAPALVSAVFEAPPRAHPEDFAERSGRIPISLTRRKSDKAEGRVVPLQSPTAGDHDFHITGPSVSRS